MLQIFNKTAPRVGLMNRQSSDESLNGSPRVNRNRKLVSRYLRKIGRDADLDLSLDSYGYCYIPFKKFLIIIRVPDDETGLVHFQTMVFDLDSSKGITKTHQKVAAANLVDVRLGQRGSLLRMEGDEISLSLSTPIRGLRYADMLEHLEDFMQTAVDTNTNLASIR